MGLSQLKGRERSAQIYAASQAVFPGGVNSPVRAFPGLEVTPLVAVGGKGDTLFDVDGRAYVDYCGSWGALILGHAPAPVVEAVCAQMAQGSSLGIITPYEEALASRIIAHYPSVEKIRFTNSGTESTMSVLRLARGFTGRQGIVKFNGNYHGHVDALLVQAGSGVIDLTPTSSSEGIGAETVRSTFSLPYNATEKCRRFLREKSGEIAAVILEPIAGNMGVVPASEAFIQMLREETERQGILLIFDEVINGFRVALGGAQELYGVFPDLTCFGKVMGGGFPCAAFGGRAEVMDFLAPTGPVYHAGTLSGNPIAMRAGLATLLELEKEGVYEELQRKTDLVTEPVREMIRSRGLNACLQQVGSSFTLFLGCRSVRSREDLASLDIEAFKQLFIALFEQGIYIPPSPYETWSVSTAHSESHLEKTREALLSFLSSRERGVC